MSGLDKSSTMSTYLISLFLLFAAPAPQTTNPGAADLCTIQGVVVKAGTGEPLRKAIRAITRCLPGRRLTLAPTRALNSFSNMRTVENPSTSQKARTI
jgi:hypothetical protein